MTTCSIRYPLGTANMLQVLHMGLHVCQLMGYGQIDDGLKLITHHSARTLNLSDYGLAAGNSANRDPAGGKRLRRGAPPDAGALFDSPGR